MNPPDELWVVARSLGDIAGEVVFVGGMVPALLVTDPAAGPMRPTDDVDCVVNVSPAGYRELSERLRTRGFSECTDEGAPICRWVVRGIRVDVMPVDPAVFGFSNVWYPSAIEHAVRVSGPDATIRITDAAHFCATKLEAYLSRGLGDWYHHDLEDFITIVDTRATLADEIAAGPKDVRDFIAGTIAAWLRDRTFVEALPGHLRPDPASQARLPLVLQRLRAISQIEAAEVPEAISQPQLRAPAFGQPLRDASELPLRVSFRSTNLDSAKYDPDSLELRVRFRGGREYLYDGVPMNVYGGLVRAASHGRYFHQWIRTSYPYRRVS